MIRDWVDFKSINGSIEGARASFEIVCESLFREKYHKENVQIIRANPGDEGIDVLIGELKKSPTIIQCKFFIENITNTQKDQIRSSFKRAIESKKYKMKKWILCIPTTLTIDDIQWWESWCDKQSKLYNFNNFELINGNELIGDLKKFDLYDNFFDISNSLILKENNEILYSMLNSNLEAENYLLKTTENKLKEIILNSVIFVEHGYYDYTYKLLNKYNCCIISGSPGVGKTITAGSLVLDFINEGYDFIYISGDFAALSNSFNPDRKQVYLFDDFLGMVSLNKNITDMEISSFSCSISEAINNNKTKIIFTTREYILNQATLEYELQNKFFKFTKKATIEFTEYSEYTKALMLFNHIEKSELHRNDIASILKNENYLELIYHKNFSPRIIEWMTTTFINNRTITNKSFYDIFIENLENPSEIWSFVFNNITDISKEILCALALNEGQLELNSIHKILYELNKNSLSDIKLSSQIDEGLKELGNSMISILNIESKTIINFLNPSVYDFMINYIDKHNYLLLKYLELYENNFIFNIRLYTLSIEKNNRYIHQKFKYPNLQIILNDNDEIFLRNIKKSFQKLLNVGKNKNTQIRSFDIKMYIKVYSLYSSLPIKIDEFYSYLEFHEITSIKGIFYIVDYYKNDTTALSFLFNNYSNIINSTMLEWIDFECIEYFFLFQDICSGLTKISTKEVIDNFNKKYKIIYDETKNHFSLDRIDNYIDILEKFSKRYDYDTATEISQLDDDYEDIRSKANFYDEDYLEEEKDIIYFDEDDDYEINDIRELFQSL